MDWLPLFAEPAYRQIILDSLNYLRTYKHTQLNAFVVMSTHVHAVLWPDDGSIFQMSLGTSNDLRLGKFLEKQKSEAQQN